MSSSLILTFANSTLKLQKVLNRAIFKTLDITDNRALIFSIGESQVDTTFDGSEGF